MKTQLVVLAALFASAFALPHKRLAQSLNATSYNIPTVDFASLGLVDCVPGTPQLPTPPAGGSGGSPPPSCVCVLNGTVGSGFPAPGQAVYNSYGSGATVVQSQQASTVPDNSYTSQCESNSCNCKASQNSGASSAFRTRTYTLAGAVDAVESIIYNE